MLNAIYLTLFVGALLVSAITMTLRIVVHVSKGRPLPRLLPRDLVLVLGLLLPFGAILTARAFGLGSALADNLAWTAVTGGLAVVGAVTFAWYEVFVIGTGRDR